MRTPTALALALALTACASRPAPRSTTPVATVSADVGESVAAADAPPARDDGRLPDLARPTRERLVVEVDPSREDFTGTATLTLTVARPTRAVVLHARDLTVESVTAAQGGVERAGRAELRLAHGGREAPEELVLTFDRPLTAGEATVTLRYRGRFNPELRGLYRVRVGDDWYAFTDFEPTDARRAFPCFDEPGFKIPWEVTVVAPSGSIAVANMPQAERAEAEGRVTWRFDPTPATSSYLVAFAVGPFDVHDGPTTPVPVRVITPRGRGALGATAATIASAHLAILGSYFDRPYPYPKLDLVAVPDFLPGAMENPGLITFRDVMLLLDPARSTNRARTNIAGIIAHELAHQWFGNLVTMAWWDDLWLNEGFATWMATRVIDAWQPALGARVDAVTGHAGARRVDALATAHAIRQPVRTTSEAMESFDSTTYAKGAAVIGMLERWLGADAFRDGIRRYLRAHEWGNATAADLLASLSAAAHREVTPVAESFLDQAGVPLVDVTLDCEGQRPALTLRQRRFRLTGESSGEQSWRVPVCVRYPDGDRPRTQCTVLERPEARVELEARRCPAWVHPNADVGGYYYYRLPRALLRQLWTTPEALDPAARLDLLSNLEDLVAAGELPADDWLDALERLAQDPSPHVQERVIGSLYSVERLLVDRARRPGFERWAHHILRPIAQRVGWRTHPGDYDTRRDLRRSVLTALGTLTNDLNARREAERVATEWLRSLSGGDPEIVSVAVPLASRRAGAARFDAIVAAIPRAATPQDRALLISSLATFDDLALVQRGYALALGDTLRQADLRSLFGRYGATPEARDLASRWVMDHWDALRQRLGRNVRGLVWSVANLCDAAKIREAREFFTPRVANLEGADRSLATAVEAASRCATTRARELARPLRRFTLPAAGVASRPR